MGTHATVKFVNSTNQYLGGLYIHYDGYLDGVGEEITAILRKAKLGNGISGDVKMGEFFNGFEDLGAQMISLLKKNTVGNVYLTTEDTIEEYNYRIEEQKDGGALISCYDEEGHEFKEFRKVFYTRTE